MLGCEMPDLELNKTLYQFRQRDTGRCQIQLIQFVLEVIVQQAPEDVFLVRKVVIEGTA